MSARRRGWVWVAMVGIASSPLGHLIAYAARFGPSAWSQQRQGVHAYFPSLAGTAAALLATAILGAILLVAGARLLRGRRLGLRAHPGSPVLELLAVLFTCQLAIYLGQETGEALATAGPLAPVPELLLWGTVGQLPVAALAALALSWLSVRLERAIEELRTPVHPVVTWPAQIPRLLLPLAYGRPPSLLSTAPAVFAKRGPPTWAV